MVYLLNPTHILLTHTHCSLREFFNRLAIKLLTHIKYELHMVGAGLILWTSTSHKGT